MTLSGSPAIAADRLGKRYGHVWGLRDCTFAVPAGSVVGLVGPNGAGKTTLLALTVGLLAPTEGQLAVFGEPARAHTAGTLARVSYLAQDHPLYRGFSVADMFRFGGSMNPSWDQELALHRMDVLGIPLRRKVKALSGGQQAQVGLTMALAKRAPLLALDEPVASLDPIARRDVMSVLMARVAETGMTVVFSSHVVSELERVCDHLVVISRSHVQLAGETDDLLARHKRLVGPGSPPGAGEVVPAGVEGVLERSGSQAQTVLLARLSGPVTDPRWETRPLTVEDIALAYLAAPAERYRPARHLSALPKGA
jgi:ABC-2 type transport system ATP-binding protein